jgi:hypothetical protein
VKKATKLIMRVNNSVICVKKDTLNKKLMENIKVAEKMEKRLTLNLFKQLVKKKENTGTVPGILKELLVLKKHLIVLRDFKLFKTNPRLKVIVSHALVVMY